MADATITLNRGSDLLFDGSWNAANMTGYTISLFEAHPALASATVVWVNATTGAFRVSAQWTSDFPDGPVISFRVRVSLAGADTTTPPIVVDVQ